MEMFREQQVIADENDYEVKINLPSNYVEIFEKNTTGINSLKVIACSGINGDYRTDVACTVESKVEWMQLPDGSYIRYATRLSNGVIIGTSPYTAASSGMLDTEKYNHIGSERNDLSIWLYANDAKWIFENCKIGASFTLFERAEMPKSADIHHLGEKSKYKTWDPTLDEENNPWNNLKVEITCPSVQTFYIGDEINLLGNVKGYDTLGNDISRKIIILGNYDLDKVGRYPITYYLTDSLGKQMSKSTVIEIKSREGENGELQEENKVNTPGEAVAATNRYRLKVMIIIAMLTLIATFVIVKYTKKE